MASPERHQPLGQEILIPRPELYPDPELVRRHMTEVTAITATVIAAGISQLAPVPGGVNLKDWRKDIRVSMLDPIAALLFSKYLSALPFHTVSVGSEGGKEEEKLGIAMPTVIGDFGSGDKYVSIVNDVIEGTTAATHGRDGAFSALGASTFKGIRPTEKGEKYVEKFFGPPEAAGIIDIGLPVQENLDRLRTVFGIPAEEITVVVMDRRANQEIIEAAKTFRAKVHLIDAGDLMPSFLALMSPNNNNRGIYLVMGRGGIEEGAIAAVAGRSLGSHVQVREWFPSAQDKDLPAPGGKLLTLDELVPGRRDQTFVAFTPITNDPWFGFKGMELHNGTATGASVILDQNGFHLQPFERPIEIKV